MGEWGPWIEHDGKGCPLPGAQIVRIKAECEPGRFKYAVGRVAETLPEIWDHEFWGCRISEGHYLARVVAYRIRRPRGLTILEDILARVEADAPEHLTPAGGGLPVLHVSPAKTPAGGAVPPPWACGPSLSGR